MNILHLVFVVGVFIFASAEPPRFRPRKSRLRFQRQELETTTIVNGPDLGANQPEGGPYPAAMGPYPAAGYRPGRAFNLPTESENSTDIPATTDTPSGPYPPSGWKPQGRQLTLPTEDETQPPATYGPPQEPPTTNAPGGPYPPSGWKPQGRQLELPTEESQPPQTYGAPSAQYGPPSETYGPPEGAETESPVDPDDDAVTVDAELDETGPSKNAQGFYFITLPDGNVQKVSYNTSPGGKIILKAESVGRRSEALVAEERPAPRVVSFVQQYQSW